jgi:hypothetical protein
LRLPFEQTYHPFISHAAKGIEEESGVKIHIPPFLANEAEQKDEISVQGDREPVLLAEEKLKTLYEQLVSFQTFFMGDPFLTQAMSEKKHPHGCTSRQ